MLHVERKNHGALQQVKIEFEPKATSSNLASVTVEISQPKTLSEAKKFGSFNPIFLIPTEKMSEDCLRKWGQCPFPNNSKSKR